MFRLALQGSQGLFQLRGDESSGPLSFYSIRSILVPSCRSDEGSKQTYSHDTLFEFGVLQLGGGTIFKFDNGILALILLSAF